MPAAFAAPLFRDGPCQEFHLPSFPMRWIFQSYLLHRGQHAGPPLSFDSHSQPHLPHLHFIVINIVEGIVTNHNKNNENVKGDYANFSLVEIPGLEWM